MSCTYLNCHHLTARTRLLSANKASNELRHPASDSAGRCPRCWSGSPWSRASPSDSEWNREKSTVAGSGRRDSEKNLTNQSCDGRSICAKFYLNFTTDKHSMMRWKKLDGGEYLPIIHKYINLLTDNYRDWKGHLIDWWSIQNVLSANNGVIYNHTNTFFQPFFLWLKANWYLDAHNGNAMLRECRCRYVNFISSINGGK